MHKIAIRDMRNNNVEIYDFKIDKKTNQNKLVALDEFLGQFKSKEDFLNSIISDEDCSHYDVYVVYNTSGGYKFLDAYFGKNVSNAEYKESMINNIVSKGLRQEEFINFLQKNYRGYYESFDHYNGKNFEYNNLKKYMDCLKDSDYSQANVCVKSIKDKLENNYNKLRRMVDCAYRFKNDSVRMHDDARELVDYKEAFSKCLSTYAGQLTVFNYLKVENSASEIVKENETKEVSFSEELISRLKEDMQEKDIITLYFELLHSEGFVDKVYESNLPKYLKNYTHRYLSNIGESYEDVFEAEYYQNMLKSKLRGKNNLKIATSLVKEYLTHENSKKL